MQDAYRIPGDLKVVVHASRTGVVREQLPSIGVLALTAVAAGFGLSASGSVAWLVIGVLCVAGVVVEVLIIRSSLALGPALAADADHVWVRVGGFLRPKSVRLDWSEVIGVGLRTWQGRRRDTARFLTIHLSDDARAALESTPNRRRRRVATTFGSPFAISDQHKTPSLDETVRGLRALAPDTVRFTDH